MNDRERAEKAEARVAELEAAIESTRDTKQLQGIISRAVIDYLRHQASGYSLLRSLKANGARDALYHVAEQLESNWMGIVGPALTVRK